MSRTKLLSELWEGKDTYAIITDILRLQGKNKKEISRLLELQNHQELTKLLDEFVEKCREIAQTKKQASQKVDDMPLPAATIHTTTDDMGDNREVFENLHKKLFSLTRDATRFFAELAKMHHTDLPTNPDAWIFWATNFPEFLSRLGDICRLKTTGDESIIARHVVEIILPELYKNPEFLIQSPQKILVPGRVITLASILDIYRHIGEGGYQVLIQILSKIQVLSMPPAHQNDGDTQEEITQNRVGINPPSDYFDNDQSVQTPPSTPPKVYIHRQGDTIGFSTDTSGLPPRKIQEAISQLNGYFSRNDSSLTIQREDLFLNPFGSLYISGSVESEKLQEMIKAFNELSIPYKISGENRV